MRSAARHEQPAGREQVSPVEDGVEPARIQLPTQPGQLALGQLPRGEDAAVAERRGVVLAVQMLPGLPVANGTQGGQLQRRGVGLQLRRGAQPPDFIQESRFEHGVEPALDAAVQLASIGRRQHQLEHAIWQAGPLQRAALPVGQRPARDAIHLQRALEVYRISGRTLTDWQRGTLQRARLPYRVLKLVLAPADRSELHRRIERRFDAMLEAGFLDEVRRLRAAPELEAHPAPLELPALRAVGYRQAWEHLDGQYDAATLRDRGIFATRQLAKRQLTWLRGQLDARWFDPVLDRADLLAARRLFVPGR